MSSTSLWWRVQSALQPSVWTAASEPELYETKLFSNLISEGSKVIFNQIIWTLVTSLVMWDAEPTATPKALEWNHPSIHLLNLLHVIQGRRGCWSLSLLPLGEMWFSNPSQGHTGTKNNAH